MDDFDSTWCPVCSRQIVPKRIPAPVVPLPSNAPPASAAPQPIPSNDTSARLARGKAGGTIRPRPQGLVHGTGRVRPNGAIKRSPPLDAPQDTKTKPVTPVRRRTVIDQTPAPLYCSDECRLADLQSIHGAIDIKYHPDRCSSPSLPPVPPNSVSDHQSSQEDSDSSSGASYDSRSSIPSPTTTTPTLVPAPATKSDLHVDAYSRLAAFYGFDPLPPPPPYTRRSKKSAAPEAPPPMEGGAMMAARRIQAALCPEKPKKSPWGMPLHNDKDDNKPIPGWTDGSNAWRASVYGFAPPRDFTRTDPDDAAIRAYGSYVASPHRSRGVHSTLGEGIAAADASLNASTASLPSRVVDASTEHLYRQYSASFTQRSKSRTSSRNGLSTSPTSSTRSLVKPGAEGRLLVPDVKMRRVNSSLSSIDGSSGASWDSQSAIISMSSVASRKRSPLSRQNSDASVDTMETPSEEDELDAARVAVSSLPTSDKARPSSTHTWSYSLETLMYPIMRVAPKEKRIVRRVIDGIEQDVEVFVEERPKRLFLFGGALD